ncbi:MAG: hypothetical protein JOZ82_11570 [Marmoricola sp.]|nr:hypothetical protein [Marmoricola sp.]
MSTTDPQPEAAPIPEATPLLTPEARAEVETLIADSDSVELKLSVADADRQVTMRALEMDPLDAQIRQVVFFDTPDLALNRRGVVVRARRVQGKVGDVVVKLRPVVPKHVPKAVRRSPSFGIEVDVMPDGFVRSGTMKTPVPDRQLKALWAADRSLSKVVPSDQASFYDLNAPAGIELDGLTPLGPVTVLKLKFRPTGFSRRMVAELWFYPDGSRILELSTKSSPGKAFEVAAEARRLLESRGVDLTAPQQTKTRTALEFFAREVRRAAGTR